MGTKPVHAVLGLVLVGCTISSGCNSGGVNGNPNTVGSNYGTPGQSGMYGGQQPLANNANRNPYGQYSGATSNGGAAPAQGGASSNGNYAAMSNPADGSSNTFYSSGPGSTRVNNSSTGMAPYNSPAIGSNNMGSAPAAGMSGIPQSPSSGMAPVGFNQNQNGFVSKPGFSSPNGTSSSTFTPASGTAPPAPTVDSTGSDASGVHQAPPGTGYPGQ